MDGRDERARRRLSRTPRQWAIVAVLASAGLCSSFVLTVIVPIQSRLPALLDASREDTAWAITVTVLAAAVATPISGRLGDMYGKRRVTLVLLAVLVVGSVIAALSGGLAGMLIGRAMQGASSGVVPLGMSILRDVMHQKHLGTAVALISATVGVGSAAGLPIGAIITEYGDWKLLFWASAVSGAAISFLVVWVVPESVLRTSGRFDYIGALGFTAGLVAILLAISKGNAWGWLSLATLACGLGGVLLLIGWSLHQLRVPNPLLDLRTAARPAVLMTNLASVGMGFAMFSSNVIFPQVLEAPVTTGSGFGLSLIASAILVMPLGLIMMLLSPVAGRMSHRFGPRVVFSLGALTLIIAYLLAALFGREAWQIAVAIALVGVGIGFGFAAIPMLIMRAVPAAETGASNGLNTLCRYMGTAIAAAAIGAVLSSMTVQHEGAPTPTAQAFNLSFWIAGAVATVTFALTLLIPRGRPIEERSRSFPERP